jgi:2-succinyl-6-hydroxy-2,4-cyclohexadiene-1-carboxylate synthase
MTKRHSPVVLLHGFTGCADVWNDVIGAMPQDYSCVALDLPGHGSKANVRNSAAYTFDGVCDSILAELKDRGISRIVLWGYSMGGRIALHFALKYRAALSALILESASPGLPAKADRASRAKADEELATRLESDSLEKFVDEWMDQPLFASQKSLSNERQMAGRQLRLRNSSRGLADALRGFSVGHQEPLHNRLRELTMPTFIMAGGLDIKYRGIGESMALSIPNAQYCIIPKAGHAPHWECPVETAAVASEFLTGTAVN